MKKYLSIFLGLAFIILPHAVHAGITFDQATQLSPDWMSVTSYTQSMTISGTNTLLVVDGVASQFSGGTAPSSITWNGTALTSLRVNNGGGSYEYAYDLLGAASGTHNLVISFSTPTFNATGAASYDGVLQSGFPDSLNTSFADTTANPFVGNTTTVANNSWVITMASLADGFSSVTNGVNRTTGGTASTNISDSNTPVTPAGSYSISLNGTGRIFGAVTLSVAPAPNIVTFDKVSRQALTNTSGGASTFSFTCSAGAQLYVPFLYNSTSDNFTSGTYNGVSGVFINKFESATLAQYMYVYMFPNSCDGSAHNIVLNFSGAITLVAMSPISYTGASATAPSGTQTGTNTTTLSPTWSQSLTPSTTGGLVAGYVDDVIGRSVTAGANTTVRADGGGQGDHLVDSGANQTVSGVSQTLNISSFSGLSPSTESIAWVINVASASPASTPLFQDLITFDE